MCLYANDEGKLCIILKVCELVSYFLMMEQLYRPAEAEIYPE